MEENKNPLESELAEALADVVMDEDNDDKHETFIKRFDTPDEIVQYWEHQLEKVKNRQIKFHCTNLKKISRIFSANLKF